ncbi:MAG: hypothetical protein QOJ90_2587, partial [Actinomycetota bacterium]|nr:hypothetical protein [Actinomycetota bacterium]
MSRAQLAAAALAGLLLLAAGCSDGSSSGAPAGTGTASDTSSASPSSSASASPSAALSTTASATSKVILKDGRYPTYILKVRPGTRQVTLDLVQFFTGAAASKAAKQDHA